MRVVCPFCLQKARIVSRTALNQEATIADLYCRCADTQMCGASFVYSLAYSRTLNPPIKTTMQWVLHLVNGMSKEEKTALRRDLQAG
ncbi:MAG: ogr/Delta-like zinc finger family protein [Methylovulum sp.]|nr:ogr/Delta-like zinc finger family protein [Methylovulum sp.]